jgi:hypothetical protein
MGTLDTRPGIVDVNHYSGDTLTIKVAYPARRRCTARRGSSVLLSGGDALCRTHRVRHGSLHALELEVLGR